MAYSFIDLANTDEDDAYENDFPLWVCNNILERSAETPKWAVSSSWLVGDISSDQAPTRLVYDRNGKIVSFANTIASLSTVSLIFDLSPSSVFESAQWDSVVILNHNFANIGSGPIVNVYIADNNTFTSNFHNVAQFTSISTNERLVDFELSAIGGVTKARYSNVQFVGIDIGVTSGNLTTTPVIGELIFGRRRQMNHRSNHPYDTRRFDAGTHSLESESGNLSRHVSFSGRRRLSLDWTFGGTTVLAGLDSQEQFFRGMRECSYAGRPMVYCEKPFTEPEASLYMVAEDGGFRIQNLGVSEQSCSIDLQELPPFQDPESQA